MGPEAIEIGAQRIDARRIQLVEPPVPHGPIDDQMRLFQDAQVLRDRRSTDWKAAREFADRLRSLQQTFEDRPPGGIAQGVKLLSVSVNCH